MVKFRITPFKGKPIHALSRTADNVIFWTVFALNALTDDWIFLKSFYTESRAKNFIEEVKKQIESGDYSCLTLRP